MEEMSLNVICVDDDASMLKAIERLIKRLRPEWKVLCCDDPLKWRDQWSYSDIEAPAIFISDLSMPDKRGDQLLVEIKNIFPDAIRVLMSASGKQSLAAGTLSYAHFVLPKPFIDQDFERVFRCTEQLANLPFNDECRRNLARFTDLPLIPERVIKLRKVIALPTSDIYKISDVISHEPVLVARIFQIANSPYLGFSRITDSLPEAVGRVGSTLVESVALTQLISIRHKHLSISRHEVLATKALRIGEISRVLAKKLGLSLANQDKVFIASLLTSIGALVLLEQGAQEHELDDFIGLQKGIPDSHIIAAYVLIMWGYEISIGNIILNQRNMDFTSTNVDVINASVVGLATQIVELNNKLQLLELANELPSEIATIIIDFSPFLFEQ